MFQHRFDRILAGGAIFFAILFFANPTHASFNNPRHVDIRALEPRQSEERAPKENDLFPPFLIKTESPPQAGSKEAVESALESILKVSQCRHQDQSVFPQLAWPFLYQISEQPFLRSLNTTNKRRLYVQSQLEKICRQNIPESLQSKVSVFHTPCYQAYGDILVELLSGMAEGTPIEARHSKVRPTLDGITAQSLWERGRLNDLGDQAYKVRSGEHRGDVITPWSEIASFGCDSDTVALSVLQKSASLNPEFAKKLETLDQLLELKVQEDSTDSDDSVVREARLGNRDRNKLYTRQGRETFFVRTKMSSVVASVNKNSTREHTDIHEDVRGAKEEASVEEEGEPSEETSAPTVPESKSDDANKENRDRVQPRPYPVASPSRAALIHALSEKNRKQTAGKNLGEQSDAPANSFNGMNPLHPLFYLWLGEMVRQVDRYAQDHAQQVADSHPSTPEDSATEEKETIEASADHTGEEGIEEETTAVEKVESAEDSVETAVESPSDESEFLSDMESKTASDSVEKEKGDPNGAEANSLLPQSIMAWGWLAQAAEQAQKRMDKMGDFVSQSSREAVHKFKSIVEDLESSRELATEEEVKEAHLEKAEELLQAEKARAEELEATKKLEDIQKIQAFIRENLEPTYWKGEKPYQIGVQSIGMEKERIRAEFTHRVNRSLGCEIFPLAVYHNARKLSRITRRNNSLSLRKINSRSDEDLDELLSKSELSDSEKSEIKKKVRHLNKVVWEGIFKEAVEDSQYLQSSKAKSQDSKDIDSYFGSLLEEKNPAILMKNQLLGAIHELSRLAEKFDERLPCNTEMDEALEVLKVNPPFKLHLGRRGQKMVKNLPVYCSGAMCLMGVRLAAKRAGYSMKYIKGASHSAKNSKKELFYNKNDFADVTDLFMKRMGVDKPWKIDPRDLPTGAIIIYSGGDHGHIEVRTDSGFASDFFKTQPINEYLSRSVKQILWPLN